MTTISHLLPDFGIFANSVFILYLCMKCLISLGFVTVSSQYGSIGKPYPSPMHPEPRHGGVAPNPLFSGGVGHGPAMKGSKISLSHLAHPAP